MNPKLPNSKIKRDIDQVQPEESTDSSGSPVTDLPSLLEDGLAQSVPYTIVVDGHNVTITSVEEYFVHSYLQNEDDLLLDEDFE
ncbi:hypothetical protein JTE90_007832 [Oedothorax gibbosus]|nr:hypothetical protein JTE90_007832 [Oedothorax gibbosus]